MTTNAGRLLDEALQLSPEERAEVAAKLLASLEEKQEDVQAAWAAEIARRAADTDADLDDEEDWRTSLNEIRREVLSR